MKGTRIATIDVGTSKVCTIMASLDNDSGLRVVGVGVAPSRGLEKAMVANINLARESIQESVNKAERMAGYRLESALVGITGRHIGSVNNQGIVAITRGDQVVRPSDLKRVMDVAMNIRSPADRRLIHTIPRSYKLDGQEVRNPVGMHGYELNVEAHVVTASAASVQNLTKCIIRCGINIEDLVLLPLASAEAVLLEEEKLSGILVADIGAGTTDIAVVKDNSICHSSVLPVAGNQVTHDISVGLGVSFDLAEEMKRKYANVTLTDTVNDSNVAINDDGHSISSRDLCDIVHARIEELIRLIVLELPRTDYAHMIPAGVVLTGGTANLPGIAELGREITRLPVRVGEAANLHGVSNNMLHDPSFAGSAGLLLWRLSNQDLPKWSPRGRNIMRFLPQVLRRFHRAAV